MAGELNKFTLNNEIVLMRHDVRKARVCLVHKITRTIKSLRSGKGSKEPSEKDLLKADKLVEEIRTLKKLEIDNITKTLLVYVDDPIKVLSDIRKSLEDRVIAKMFTIKSMETSISKFRRKYPNWLEDVPALLKTMKKKKPKKKIKDNPKKIITSAGDNNRPAALKNCESNGGVPEIIEKNKNNVKASIRSTSGSWTVSGSVENLCIGNEGSSKKGKLKRVTKPKIPPNVGKITKNGEKINEEFDEGSSTNAKRLGVDSDMESEEGGGERRDIVSGLKKPENDQKNVEKNREDSKKFKRNITKFNMEKDEDSFGSRIKVGERIDNEKVMFELGKKDLKLEVGLKSSKNGIDDDRFQLTKTIDKKFSDGMNGVDEDLEKRFKNSKKPDKPVSGKKKEEIKVADPFFMTNDNSEYLTVVSSKEQAEALQNPSETSSNYRNNDEELYYGSSLTGGFKQISHHERRKSMVTNLSRGSTGFPDRNFRQFGKDGGRNEANFKNRESLSSSSHALPRRERRRLMNGGGKETKIDGEEKLHPSWEAKRRQSCPAIPQFSGKKIVFDD